MSHTPTPYYTNEDGDICATVSGFESVIALPVPHSSIARYNQAEDAAFIVTACNAHDALIAALKDIAEACNCCGDRSDLSEIASKALKAV